MFGGLRLALAVVVALAHLPDALPGYFGIMWGVPAAVMFYVLSGFAMTALLRSHYARLKRVPGFYLDRFTRIGPQYYVLFLAVVLWWHLSGTPSEFFLKGEVTAIQYLENILILPLNYFMYNGSWQFAFIPTSWMLGTELQFYLIFPFLFLFRLRMPALLLAIGVMMLAHWGMLDRLAGGVFPGSDVFGYRLMPGVLVYFLVGSFLYDMLSWPRSRLWVAVLAITACVAGWCVCLLVHGTLDQNYIRGTMLGLIIGVYAVVVLSGVPRRRTDEILGHLSYGVYLNHFFVQWALLSIWFPLTGAPAGAGGVLRILVYLAGSLVVAGIGWRVLDDPVMRWRRRRRALNNGAQMA